MSPHRFGTGRCSLVLIVISVIASLPMQAAGDSEVPAAVAALLPPGLQLKSQSWGVFRGEEEFEGTQFNGEMFALFPGSVSCDFTIGPDFRFELKGDTAWAASPEQLDMWVQMNAPNFEADAASMVSSLNTQLKGFNHELAIATPQSEQLPNGHITFVEFTWKCPNNPQGANIMLDGYARRGTTVLTFRFWSNGAVAEAKAMAGGIFDRFEKLDIAALLK
jgi:hypothetical protein